MTEPGEPDLSGITGTNTTQQATGLPTNTDEHPLISRLLSTINNQLQRGTTRA